MGRCTSCGFEPPYPTTTCPQCGGVVSAGSPVAGVAPPPVADPPVADRTMRRSDLTNQAPYAAPPPSPSAPDAPISGVPQWGQGGGSLDAAPPPPPPPYGASPSTAYPPPSGIAAGGGMGSGARPSDLGTRFLALLIDYVVMWVPLLVVFPLVALTNRSSIVGLFASLIGVAVMLAGLAIMVVPMGRTGQTIGGAVMGVQVVDAKTGAPIGVGRAIARLLIWSLMGSICYLGYISYFLDKSGYQRGFNDQAADSVAVVGPKVGFAQALKNAFATLRP